MRKKFVAGNWKMYTTAATARRLAADVVHGLAGETRVAVAVCPPFPYLSAVAEVLRGSPVALGAQNLYPAKEGAYTGEVSPTMLLDVGCKYVILGHSERRHKLGESDAFINRKLHAALSTGLHVILSLGETLDERTAKRTEMVLDGQLTGSLADLDAPGLANVVLAYEPVWAIGTGVNATPEQAQQAHAFIRRRVGERFGADAAGRLLIQYGGSVKPDNAAALLHQTDVDGGLIGGASLKAGDFLAIVRAALPGGK
jgi:triosephosphate isomerase